MYRHIMVTLDGTPEAESVLPHALELARATGCEVTVLRVVDTGGAEWSERGAVGRPDAAVSAVYTEQAEQYLEHAAAQLRREGASTHTVVRQGEPARLIVSTAREVGAELIAMSTHSRRGINRLVFGSVAEEVLHESHVPVLLVRTCPGRLPKSA